MYFRVADTSVNRLNGQVDYLQSQFALVGDKKSNDQSILMMDGPADYLLYTTGRRNVQFGHWWLKVDCKSKDYRIDIHHLLLCDS